MTKLIRPEACIAVFILACACSGESDSASQLSGGGATGAGATGAGATGAGAVGGSGTGTGGSYGGSAGRSAGGSAGSSAGGSAGSSPGGAAGSSSTGGTTGTPPPPTAGLLTAGTWDDNRNYDRFLSYREQMLATQSSALLGFQLSEHDSAVAASPSWLKSHTVLDLALVIDATGSMGDEINYLKAELIGLSTRIGALHPNAQQRWSLVVYRDIGDQYVARSFSFDSDVKTILTSLKAQAADGGGDYPEAPDAAFEEMNQLAWRSGDNVARLAFWFADAPHHSEKAAAFTKTLRTTRGLGVHVYPVASSGVDEVTEFTMRSAAQTTGGRYLFLTDDSGIGGVHKEPSIPCYFVTKLDDAIVRMVDIEMSGVYREPDSSEIIRTGGNPKDGACQLESGTVVAF